jgi:hypothetical protein
VLCTPGFLKVIHQRKYVTMLLQKKKFLNSITRKESASELENKLSGKLFS